MALQKSASGCGCSWRSRLRQLTPHRCRWAAAREAEQRHAAGCRRPACAACLSPHSWSQLQAHARKRTAGQRVTASLYPACHYNLAPTLRASLMCLVVFSAAAHAGGAAGGGAGRAHHRILWSAGCLCIVEHRFVDRQRLVSARHAARYMRMSAAPPGRPPPVPAPANLAPPGTIPAAGKISRVASSMAAKHFDAQPYCEHLFCHACNCGVRPLLVLVLHCLRMRASAHHACPPTLTHTLHACCRRCRRMQPTPPPWRVRLWSFSGIWKLCRQAGAPWLNRTHQ